MSLKEVLAKINGSTLDQTYTPKVFVDSGSYALNYVISGKYSGGYPLNFFTEISGESSSGKTVLLSHAILNAQKMGWYTGIADNEGTYDKFYAQGFGVDTSQLLYANPETVPESFEVCEKWVKEIREYDKDTPILLGIDSMAAMSGKEQEKEISEFDNMDGAVRAKETGQCIRKLNPMLLKQKVAIILINQVRAKPGVMYGDPTTMSGGGKALEFFAACRLKIGSNQTSDVIKNAAGDPIGKKGKIITKKNKIAVPFRECEFKLDFTKGLNRYYGLADALVNAGLVEKTGAWYKNTATGEKFQGEKGLEQFYQSKEFIEFLKNN